MTLSDFFDKKIPLVDDVLYFIPKGVNTLEEYKRALEHDEAINKISTKKDIPDSAEEEIQLEEIFYEEYEQIEEIPSSKNDLLDDFISIEGGLPDDIKEDVIRNKKNEKEKIVHTNKSEIIFVPCKDLSEEDELISLEEFAINENENKGPILVIDNSHNNKNLKEEKIQDKSNEEDDESVGIGSLIGTSLDLNINDIIYNNTPIKVNYPTSKKPLDEVEDSGDEDGNMGETSLVSLSPLIENSFDYLNKKQSLSVEEEEELNDMLEKINSINELNDIDDEDDMIDMLGKIRLEEFKDED